jgi:Zn-dependent protease
MLFTLSFHNVLLLIIPLLTALTFHEYSHAKMAFALGDDTGKQMGRITLNPLAHLDFIGTLCIIFSGMFGWAKPVPVNPAKFHSPARDMALVAAAGPASNFIFAVALSFAIKWLVFSNLIDKLPKFFSVPFTQMLFLAFMLNLGLCFFNLIPFPPLDGFRIVSAFLPQNVVDYLERLRIVFFFILIILITTKVFTSSLTRVVYYFSKLLLR